ncbi:MAG: protein translocase subunit SecD [Ectopseudomonas oleovorans]|nr:MAG: protein translocase subunit SecD [Pseudomonas oleovorans]
MLNKYPLWKYALIVLVLVVGFIYSAPNLYPDDPAVQISGASSALQVNQADLDRVSKALVDAKIAVKGTSLGEKGSGLIRLTNQEDQLPAKDVVRKALGDDYVVALNLAQTTPQWLRNLGASPMKLGLDLSGGVHFLLDVDMDKAMSARMKVYEGEVKTLLRKERVRYRSLPQQDGGIMLGFADDATREQARALIRKNFNDFDLTTTERNDLAVLRLALTQAKVAEIREYSIKQNLTTVRNRVNELGVAEPLVQRQGANRIVVELPGVQDTAEAKRILGKTANLEFRFGAEPGASKATTEVFEFREGGRSAAVERGLIITGDQVTDAQASFDEHGRPQVNIRLDGHGGELMSRATRSNVGRSMAVIFIEQKPVTRYVRQTIDGVEQEVAISSFVEEKKIISLATIQSPLGSQFRITGLNGQGESSELALLLRAGGLAAPMYFAEERTIGPSLGAENIAKGIASTEWAMIFVSLFIIAIYRFFGVLATVALAFNLVLLVGLMSAIGATLTLPGIAGIVLTLGMAVDANVLIFSRIREELANGLPVQRALHEGFDRAYSAILDSNLTTLLVGGILFAMGTGPVKGFAVTLSLGIITSMFTAIMFTRGLVNLIFGGRNFKKLWI